MELARHSGADSHMSGPAEDYLARDVVGSGGLHVDLAPPTGQRSPARPPVPPERHS